MHRKTRNWGFSLIEIMLAVGVASILAAVGLPWYGDNVRRTKVAEGVTLAAPTKMRVTGEMMGLDRVAAYKTPAYSCGMDQFGNPVCPIAHEVVATNPSKGIRTIVRAGNLVVVNYSAELAGPDGTLYSLVLAGNQNAAGVSWQCLADKAAAAELSRLSTGSVPIQAPLPAKWAPKNCLTGTT